MSDPPRAPVCYRETCEAVRDALLPAAFPRATLAMRSDCCKSLLWRVDYFGGELWLRCGQCGALRVRYPVAARPPGAST